MGTTGGQKGDGSFAATAAAARLEWIERQGNSDGLADMEVRGASVSFGGVQAATIAHVAGCGRRLKRRQRRSLCAVLM